MNTMNEVILAYRAGKRIQLDSGMGWGDWDIAGEPPYACFGGDIKWRIHPDSATPAMVPWGREEWERTGMVRSITIGTTYAVLWVGDSGVYLAGFGALSFDAAAACFTQLDGSPCTKEAS